MVADSLFDDEYEYISYHPVFLFFIGCAFVAGMIYASIKKVRK